MTLKKVTNCVSTRISSQKIKPFDTRFEPTMSTLANVRVILKVNSSVLVQKRSSSLYSNFILSLYIVYKLINWPPNPINNFTLGYCFFATVKSTRKEHKTQFTYTGWGTAFDSKDMWGFGNGFARNFFIIPHHLILISK